MATDLGFACIPILESKGGGGGGGAFLIYWPRGWMPIWGGCLLEHGCLFEE